MNGEDVLGYNQIENVKSERREEITKKETISKSYFIVSEVLYLTKKIIQTSDTNLLKLGP